MSLILDALRKSEHQRQREAGPALAVVPESPPVQRRPRWMPALVALLALNVVVLALVLLRDSGPAPTEPARPAPAAATPARPAPAAADRETERRPVALPARPPTSEVRPLTTELPTAPVRSATGSGTGGAAASAPQQAGAPAAAAPPADAGARAEADAQLPRFADLVVRGELNVPHMHLDIHVYSGDPAQRFVFINMKRYNEGEATAEGPRVERIVPGGVVMDHRGQRFLLTRN
ncbi:general secretion pathway protein GspB [Thioalkalivibrio sp. XN8]|uniref:general secretion pathway protein GspB n=1 Tax=Thioalkalivibrio sp. XN8 TaxID=2712863 RepID=UPI0013EAB805|nr:general secretion pathway protein GspB [Thioalkalivibrio sp. XN8]NGP52565.1 general secretion pathway protein GspB [Thioalkalivibrio sp. XN8]